MHTDNSRWLATYSSDISHFHHSDRLQYALRIHNPIDARGDGRHIHARLIKSSGQMDIHYLLAICVDQNQLFFLLYSGKNEMHLARYGIGIDVHPLLIASGEWIRTGRKGIVNGAVASVEIPILRNIGQVMRHSGG